jgi:hypothetical protein
MINENSSEGFKEKLSSRPKLSCNLTLAMKINKIYISSLTTLQCQNMNVPITEYSELKLIS